MTRWLPNRSVEAVRDALVSAGFDLGDAPVVLAPWAGGDDPLWFRGSAFVGDAWVVKFAWSEAGAVKLEREIRVLRALATLRSGPPIPAVSASSTDPVLLAYRFVGGSPLTAEFLASCAAKTKLQLARSLGLVLAAFHSAGAYRAVRDADVELDDPTPQADTASLRQRLCPYLSRAESDQVERWCGWVDRVLAGDARTVLVHGDFHGHNLVIAGYEVQAVLDLEEAAYGDPHYDFRYLPAQEATLELFLATADQYESLTGGPLDHRRVMAWHVRTVLGDAMWRLEAGRALPGGGTVARWIDDLDRRFDLLGIDVDV